MIAWVTSILDGAPGTARIVVLADGETWGFLEGCRADGITGASPDGQCAVLAEIAAYIHERDPLMIGAAWLLEHSGHERSQMTLLPPEEGT